MAGFDEVDRCHRMRDLGVLAAPRIDRGTTHPTKPIQAKKTVRRNEPCPCGSGKKFKKCCRK